MDTKKSREIFPELLTPALRLGFPCRLWQLVARLVVAVTREMESVGPAMSLCPATESLGPAEVVSVGRAKMSAVAEPCERAG